MKPRDELSEYQESFAAALFDRAHEVQATSLFKDDEALVRQRLALYRGNLTSAWEKTLASIYPVIRVLVGEECFAGLARSYGKSHPSIDGDLNRFGKHFAQFLQESAHLADYPYLPDVARLEWAMHVAYYADTATPLTTQYLSSLSAQEADDLCLTLHPSCTLFASEWNAIDIWRAHQKERTTWPSTVQRQCFGIVVRPKWEALVLELPPAAWQMLARIDTGLALGPAIDAALAVDAAFDLAETLKLCLNHGVFVMRSDAAR
ncbi:MAG: hypothetical protein K0S28_1787 [Paucimonas sp.]|jgi:hypothetical protein|nr:hypothetical protein [Paucimonas sp.]